MLLHQDSPNEVGTGVNIVAFFRRSGKADARCGRLPVPWPVRTVVEGLVWPFSLH